MSALLSLLFSSELFNLVVDVNPLSTGKRIHFSRLVAKYGKNPAVIIYGNGMSKSINYLIICQITYIFETHSSNIGHNASLEYKYIKYHSLHQRSPRTCPS